MRIASSVLTASEDDLAAQLHVAVSAHGCARESRIEGRREVPSLADKKYRARTHKKAGCQTRHLPRRLRALAGIVRLRRLKDDFAADNGKAVAGIRASPVRHHEGWLIVDLGKSG